MREILFRGKRIYDGQWSESAYPYGEMHSDTVTYDYDRKTVCEYTGFTDKNGKKIFEGDICEYKNTDGEYGIGIINYDYVNWIGRNVSKHYIITPLFYLKCGTEWKVIGNIFDNPELLTED